MQQRLLEQRIAFRGIENAKYKILQQIACGHTTHIFLNVEHCHVVFWTVKPCRTCLPIRVHKRVKRAHRADNRMNYAVKI